MLFAPPERWSDRHRLHFVWDAADRVLCYSSDVGTDVWEREVDGSWKGKAWIDIDIDIDIEIDPPETLRPFPARRQARSR